MQKTWVLVKTKHGHLGRVLVDESRPIPEQIGENWSWYGVNVPPEREAALIPALQADRRQQKGMRRRVFVTLALLALFVLLAVYVFVLSASMPVA